MLKESLIEFYERDLIKLKEEISLYKSETDIWLVRGEISNSAGNLCLHLVGNLNHFIGATLGHTGYLRNRDLEFSSRNTSRLELISMINKTLEIVLMTIRSMDDADFKKDFPLLKHDKVVSTDNMLIHLFGHLNYHLGQINYHRRLLS